MRVKGRVQEKGGREGGSKGTKEGGRERWIGERNEGEGLVEGERVKGGIDVRKVIGV